MTTSGNQGSNIENDDQEKAGRPSYRQSAGVCDEEETNMCSSIEASEQKQEAQSTSATKHSTAASQRIYAKEL